MRKRKILYIAAIVICLSIITNGTLAYFTTADTARNVITMGHLSADIITSGDIGIDGSLNRTQIMPGTDLDWSIAVENRGEHTAWTRVCYDMTVFLPSGLPMDVSDEELQKVILIQPDTEDWLLKDGWWYYRKPLATGETTVPLFDQIRFSGPLMGNEYQNCTVEITVLKQAVQYVHNGNSVLEAQGWPEK